MNIKNLLSQLKDNGVRIRLDGDKLICEFPKEKLGAELKSALIEHKEEIKDYIRSNQVSSDEVELVARECSADLLPSHAQQRLWFIDQLEGGSAQYNMPSAFELLGELDESALIHSLESILERHQVLRTRFVRDPASDQLTLKLDDSVNLPLHREDLSDLDESAQQAAIASRYSEEMGRSFALDQDVLLRVQLLHCEASRHVVLFNMHHIASDGWSVGVLVREFCALYEAYSQGQTNPLPPLKVQYSDYAHWQQRWLSDQVLEEELGYWRDQLSDLPVVHSVPLDHARPTEQGFGGAVHRRLLDGSLVQGLKGLCRDQDVTLFMALQSAFAVLLSRYSGSSDIVMGTPIAGRTHESVEGLIGLFVNTLVLRSDVDLEQSFEGLLRENRERVLGAYSHQHLPFEMLVEALKPERSLSHSPLFQIMFSMNNTEKVDLSLPGLELRSLEGGVDQSIKFDLSLEVNESEDGLSCHWSYSTDLFLQDTIERFANSFEALLTAVVQNPQTEVGEISLLGAAEEQQLVAWNNTSRDYPEDRCIQHLFEDQVVKDESAVAVIFEGESLSYGELNRRANQLAHDLIKRGVGPDDLVGICMERSLDLVVGILGILKAGGAYLPLDPGYPQARLSYMIEDSQTQLILSHSDLRDTLPDTQTQWVYLDELDYSSERDHVPEVSGLSSHNLCYVIYTSGSTGQPKGVMLEHRGLVNLVSQQGHELSVDSSSRMLQFASISFDAASWEWSTILSAGGVLVMHRDVHDADVLAQMVSQQRISHALLPASFISVLPDDALTGMSCLVTGGEACPVPLAQNLHCQVPLVNAYGPTESTVIASMYRYDGGSSLPIGRPIDNTELWVLDSNQSLVPIGGVGELCIGGVGLARGYLNRPELTSEKFIRHPYSDDPQARLYRSGDLVRWTAAGELEFLGRLDHQVKIRGFRVELGEIENRLLAAEGMVEAAVIAVGSEVQQLAAYIVPAEDLSEEQWPDWLEKCREKLKSELPEYMVPAFWKVLDRLPSTSNGKLDRKALPAPSASDRQSQAYVAPRNELESQLCDVWAGLLPVDQVGIHDNFFELGGHSLLATQLVSQIRRAFAVELPLKTLFSHPTVAALSEEIAGLPKVLPVPSITRADRSQNLTPSYAQQRLWFIDQLEGGSAQYNLPSAFVLEGELDKTALVSSLQTIIDRHEVLRTRFVADSETTTDESVSLQIDSAAELPLTETDLSQLSDIDQMEAVNDLFRADINQPFALDTDVLLRVHLIRLSVDRYVLLANMHHIASDGWSVGVMIEELCGLYADYRKGGGNHLPPLAVQYVDYALWQRQWLQGDVLEQQLEYWCRQLADLPQVHNLPLDNPRPLQQSFVGAVHQHQLEQALNQQLKQLCAQYDVTLFMLLETAFAALLSRYSGSDDIVIGTPIAGRSHADLEPLIGFFVNTLVLRTDLSGCSNFEQLLAANKKMLLDAFHYQHVPFEMVVDAVKPKRSLSHSPLFQISFALQSDPAQTPSLDGLTVSSLPSADVISKFDLELTVIDRNGSLDLSWAYNQDLFLAETIERMAGNFAVLLNSLAKAPEKPLSDLALLDEAEKRLLTGAWNETAKAFPEHRCIHQLFEDQVAKDESAPAVIFEGESLSYGELNRRSNQLAHYLIKQGMGPEDLVGICMERSLELMVSVLGVLKAGAAYVPLDPGYPPARLSYMIEDSQTRLILSHSDLRDTLPDTQTQWVYLDELDYSSECDHVPEVSGLSSHNLCYVIYTSGSTGQPKGAMLEHRGLVNLALQQGRELSVDSSSRMLQFASISFDAASWEWATILSAGGALVMHRDVHDADVLTDLVKQEHISHAAIPASFVAILPPGALAGMKYLVNGGEALPVPQAQRVHKDVPVVNAYGPTESTVIASMYRYDGGSSLPIGRPIDNTELWVLDSNQSLVPIGGVGELCIGGVGLARGYLNRPELTAEKFIRHPYSDDPQAHLYRSGDLVRWTAAGELEFLGRLDHQVKIRGFRVELGEIENRLLAAEGMVEAAVIAVGGEVQQLAAYIVPTEDLSEEQWPDWLEQCREKLKSELPEYMVPAFWKVLDRLPSTSNGKLDRKALPAPSASDRQSQAYVAPRTELEGQLCEVWLSLLPVELVGIHDNFFELGGHSLLATRLVSQLRRMLSVEVSLKQVFSHPTVAELAGVIAEAERSQLPELVPADDAQGHIPSHAQQRLWFIDQLEGGSAQYNMPSAFELLGELDEAALEQSLNSVLSRHTVLRTRFIKSSDRDELVLTVDEDVSVPLTYLDLSTLGESEQLEVIRERYQEEISRPFALDQDVLLRVQLLRCEASRHVVLFNMHHIASDGWSVGVLVREFCALYEAYSQGQANPLPPLKVQYSDYAHWQQRWLSDQVLEEELGYWRDQLSDLPVVHSVPLDHARPTEQGFGGAVHRRLLDGSLVQGLKGLCRDQDVTLFMALQSAFAVLLSRYSGSSDIVMGTPIAGRTHESVEGLIGLFVNTLVLRSDVDLEQSFEGLLRENRERVLGAYSHQHLPFEMLVEALKPERSLSHSPLFQIMFSMNNTEKVDLSLPGLELRSLEGGVDQSIKFDLSLEVNESEDGLSCHWSYSTDLFLQDTIERFANSFEALLTAVVQNPQTEMGEISLLGAAEEQQLVAWNNTSRDYPEDRCIQHLFEDQVVKDESAVAVIFEGESLSYGELNRRANQLAHDLIKRGVGPDDLVGICMQRSLDLVVGILGILKAGGAYLPLDPNYPVARLQRMLDDSAVSLVLTQQRLQHLIPAGAVCLDQQRLQTELSEQSIENPDVPSQAGQLAYVIYTSGSTGMPKGALVEHRSLINHLSWMRNQFGLDSQDCVLQKTPYSFDVSVWEFLLPLTQGARLVLARPGGHKDPDYLVGLIVEQQVSHLHFVPSMLNALLSMADWSACTSVKRVFSGGEALSKELKNRFYETGTQAILTNMYGPAESTIDVSFWECSADSHRSRIPIGKPVDNVQLYVVNSHLQLQPIGGVGELLIGGVGLARGYLNRPELTAERFIPNPFSDDPQSRVYRTGDLARWLPSGELEFLGRLDHQVKLRGFRIELGEIESHLKSLDSITDAAVMAIDQELVAYVVAAQSSPEEDWLTGCREALRAVLPEYMVPASWVVLPELPLSSNGKLDRKALPAPSASDRQSQAYVAPRTELEGQLCEVWLSLLPVDQVGIHDNFFELGGHSLLATRLVSQLRRMLSVEVSLKQVFSHPTVAELASVIAEAERSQLPELSVSDQPPQPSHAQQRLWFIDQLEGGSAQYNMPSAFELLGELDEAALEQSLNSVLSRHTVLRTRFIKSSDRDELVLTVDEDVSVPLTYLDLSTLGESEQLEVIRERYQEEISRPFALDQDVLLRVQLLRCEASRHVVLFNMHHIASDGWSVGVLVREFCALYEAYSQGQANPLPPLKVQYSDYAHWQQRWLSDQVLEEELGYWRDQLSDLPVVHSVPLDHARPTEQGFGGAVHRRLLDGSLVQGLKGLCRDQDVTLFMALQSAFAVLLGRYSGSSDIVMGTPIAGRTHESVEGLIGLFVNTLVLRSDVDLEQSFEGLLRENRERVLGAYSHQHLPFEMLVEALKPERSLSHSPLFQIMFSMNTTERTDLELPGLSLSGLELGEQTGIKFDLNLEVSESEEGLWCQWSYNTDLFLPATIERFAGNFEVLLGGLLGAPKQPLADVALLGEAERQQTTTDWNLTDNAFPSDICYPALFEEQAGKSPEAVALCYENQTLTYRVLNERANQLAHYLIDRGVGTDQLIGLHMERSLEMVIGILAILKAGAAYVPLDPDYPSARLQHMLDDSAVSWVLSQSHLQPLESANTIYPDQPEWQTELAKYSKLNPVCAVDPGQLAYVIYTSGSTGLPKGVLIEHRALINRLHWMQREYGLNPNDRVLQKTPYSFDVSVWEFLWPLAQGARMVIAKPGGHKDPQYLVDLIVEQQISHLHFVPSMLNALLITADWSACSSVKQVFCSGEALSRELVNHFFQTGTQAELHNLYGPTEAAIDVSYWACKADLDQHSVPIGRPIDNIQLYVVNPMMRGQPIGGVGELLIGGVGLARGYLNRPELTAERFIPNPFSDDPQSRVYRTGDLARWLPSGELEFLGRLDHQVKLRGFRIELGEIESHLKSLDSITDAAVMAIDQELVAYVVAAQSSPEEDWLTGCREALRAVLPEYMVPASWVVLPELPLSSNGKLDRKALPAPSASDRQSQAYVAPRTELEGQLCEVWLSLLPVDQVGIHDNFFELGGHSLLATRLVSQLRRMLSVEVSLKQVFSHPTVAELASVIAEAERSQLPELSVSDQPPQPSHAQQRLWFIDQLEGGSAQYNMPSAFELLGELDEAALEQSLNSVLSRHTVLRTRFIKSSDRDELVLTVDEDVSVPLTYLDLSTLGESEQLEVIRERYQEEISRPFALDQDVLLRVQLLRCEASRHVVLFNMHHIASDGWSVGVLVREFCALYEAYSQGQANPLPPLKVQYSDYAHWQQSWLSDQVLEEELGYWRDQLSDLPVVHSVPLDHARPTEQGFGGAVHRRLLDGSLVQGLKGLCRDQDVTLFMALQSAFAVLLGRYSGSSDIVMGTPIAGRTHESVEGLIGLFVNTLVLRSDVDLEQGFEGLLRENRERVLGAYSHQHLPFEMLVEALKPERSLSHSPLFQIMFSMNTTERVELALPNLSLNSLDLGGDSGIKFDLSLEISETADGLLCHWSYNTDLFLDETVGRFAESFAILLESVVADGERALGRIDLLGVSDKQQLLAWNDTARPYQHERCVHHRFEEQVSRTPDAPAVVFEGEVLSYGELNRRSNQLAHYLIEQGVGADQLVGLCMERSLDLVVAILGILKAGGAYVPLDPAYPEERLAYMLDDTGASMLISQTELPCRLPESELGIIYFDRQQWQTYPEDNPVIDGLNGANLSHVIYTSGSTGQPKGVMIEHRSVTALMSWVDTTFVTAERSAVLCSTSVCFDLFVFEYWSALLSGGKLHLVGNILSLVEDTPISCTLINTVPSAMKALLDQAFHFKGVKTVNLAGEALPQSLLNRIFEQTDVQTVFNLYGPTEDTVYSTCARFDGPIESKPSIGSAIANTQLYVLNPILQPVPVGAVGELLIGGAGLARGYLNRPQLTEERFIPNPFSDDDQARLYRTGDLVRWLPSGELEFLGRLDHQVKLRGFRIELGEIESHLQSYDQVSEAVVIAVGEEDRQELVAYLVATEEPSTDEWLEACRENLRSELPEYMVPTSWMVLSELPLSPNGKLDRKALPVPSASDRQSQAYVAPRNELESQLCDVWAGLLPVDQVGTHDNFFELGGHSLLATRLVSQLRQLRSVEVSLKQIFSHPTIAELCKVIEQSNASELPALTVSDQPAQASHAQQRLWFIDQLEGGSAQYNMPSAFELRGKLDESALMRSLEEIVSRHAVLRTRFVRSSDSDELVLTVDEDVSVPLTRLDLSTLGESEQLEVIRERYQEEISRPFTLEQDVLLRVQLLRCEESRHVVLFNMHHIASDGWSIGVLIKELVALYEAYSQGQANPLARLPVQYSDYAHWQHQWLQGEVLQGELDYWREVLSDLPVVHSVPLDHARPAEQGFGGAVHRRLLEASLVQGLKGLCRDQDVTLFMALQSAFAVLLSRYSGSSDIVMGTPIAGRTHESVEGLIGLFVNTLVLRSDVDLEQSFEGLLRENRERVLGAYSHQHLPFEMLVEALKPERSLSHSPLFQIMFSMNNTEKVDLSLPGLELRSLEGGVDQSIKFDLSLEVNESEDGLSCHWSYSTDLFLQDTIERFAESFAILVESVVADAQQQVGRIELLGEVDKQQLLAWNDTARPYQHERCVHHWIEEQVSQTPDAPAVVFEGEVLSYGELNRRSNQLAHYLIEQGVGADQLVGLCMERSLELVVAILGILKAGGAYLPLDPDYPAARLQHMLDDSAPSLVITQEQLRQMMPAGSICIDQRSRQAALSEQSIDNPVISTSASQLAYAIYTSGSTGKPKGTLVEHRSLSNHLSWMQKQFGLDSQDCVLQKTPYSFDVSVWEFLLPLTQGARLVLAKPGGHKDPEYLVDLIIKQQVSHLHFVPSMLNVLLSVADWSGCTSVKRVFSGGEALSKELKNRFYATGTRALLTNMYGPAEATIDVSFWECHADSDLPRMPIGKPVDNVQLHVVNGVDQLQPIGATGELLIGGVALARGYLNRPELTKERFIPNPFSDDGQARLYRTGDLVRWLPSGELEFLGRLDHQVKLRGFRIELGEIESHLQSRDDVSDTVVMPFGQGDQQELVAYLVPTEETSTDGWLEACRETLRSELPEYMVPSSWIVLSELPLSPNGKLDRSALPKPAASDRQRREFAPPRNSVESQLCEIWASILPVDRVGIFDDFFELGGHSLLAMKLVSRIRQSMGYEVPVKVLFSNTTVSGLASELDQYKQRAVLPDIQRQDTTVSQPASFAQQRLWFIHQLDPGTSQYNMFQAVTLNGRVDTAAVSEALHTIVGRHTVLRSVFKEVDGKVYQTTLESFDSPLSVVDLSGLPRLQQQHRIDELTRRQAIHPFDLRRDVLVRAQLILISDQKSQLLFNMHHIASDGWSIGILVKEFSQLYSAYSSGGQNPLPELEIQYMDFARWQHEWLNGERLEEASDYWQAQLDNLPTVHDFPLDKRRPAKQRFNGQVFKQQIDLSRSEQLLTFARSNDVTLFMLMQTAFSVLLSRYSGATDIVMGTPVSGRDHGQTEPLIGLFINTLVLRTDLQGNPGFKQLLESNKKVILDAQSHQQLPLELLIDQIKPERSLSYSPLFQIMIVMQNERESSVPMPGLELEVVENQLAGAKFDLELVISQRSDGIRLSWVYNTDLFFDTTIHRLSDHFANLLSAITANPTQPIRTLPLFETPVQDTVIESSEPQQQPEACCLHEQFERQAARNPAATAIVFGDQTLTYDELNRRANRIAHHLMAQGVGPDSLVGVCLERSLDLMVAVIGVLKAGGAYVPIDPSYPDSRKSYMLSDSAVKVVLTHADLAAGLGGESRAAVCLDSDWDELKQCPENNPDRLETGLTPDHLAYVIYTSGSTGQPKGVLVPHKSVMAYCDSGLNRYYSEGLGGSFVVTSLSFDATVPSLYLPLFQGGRLVLMPNQEPLEHLWRQLLSVDEGQLVRITPSHIKVLPSVVDAGQQSDREHVFVVGGEALSVDSLRVLQQHFPHSTIFNHYGPTEGIVGCCAFDTREFDPQRHISVPIGAPLDHAGIYLLDDHLQPVPDGGIGEICIGRQQLARGYLNQPDLTAEKFIPNPFGNRKYPTIYRTGDLARRLTDGPLEFIGRRDQQLKIRGYRIEPGEIEAQLLKHELIKNCAVIGVGDPDQRSLAAYVVIESAQETVDSSHIRQVCMAHLQSCLPDYMVPSAYVVLDQLPLNSNGKLDRAALPLPDDALRSDEDYVPPVSEVECQLCEIWQDVLRIDRVGINDNFFESGGDSILSMQIVSRARKQGLQLTVRAVFEHQTIAELAPFVVAGHSIAAEQGWVRGDVPLLPIQQWFFDRELPEQHHYNQSVLLSCPAGLDPEILEKIVTGLFVRHDALRLRFYQEQGHWRSSHVEFDRQMLSQTVVLEDIGHLQAEDQQSHVTDRCNDHQASLDIRSGPLLKFVYFQAEGQPGKLLIAVHHLIIDGVSWRVLLSDLEQGYQQAVDGLEVSLSDKTSSFQQWSLALNDYARSSDLADQRDYWLKQISVRPAPLPGILNNQEGQEHWRREFMSFQLSPADTTLLTGECNNAFRTQISELLLAALLDAYHQCTGEPLMRVDLESHGREPLFDDLDTSETLGWFTSLYPLILSGPDNGDTAELVKRVKEDYRNVPNQGIGYGILTYVLRDEAFVSDRAHSQTKQIVFNYLGNFDSSINDQTQFSVASEDGGLARSPRQRREELLTIDGLITEGRLRFSLLYENDRLSGETAQALAQHFEQSLKKIISTCLARNQERELFGKAKSLLVGNITDESVEEIEI